MFELLFGLIFLIHLIYILFYNFETIYRQFSLSINLDINDAALR